MRPVRHSFLLSNRSMREFLDACPAEESQCGKKLIIAEKGDDPGEGAVSASDLSLPPPAEGSAEVAARMKLSARGYHRVLRVARTLADLDGADGVRRLHIAEALSYRRPVYGI